MTAERVPTRAQEGFDSEKHVIETRWARIWMGEDGILRQIILPGAEVALRDAKENIEVFNRICRGRRSPVFVDGRNIRSATREARQYYSREEAARSDAPCDPSG